MIYLLLAIASSSSLAIFMRLSGKYVKNEMGMFMANYGICSVLSVGMMTEPLGKVMSSGTGLIVGLGLITGVLYLAAFALQKYNMVHNGIVLTSTFSKLGILIPTLMAVVVFGEKPGMIQAAGILLAITAIVMVQFEKEALKEGRKKIWLLAVLIACGTADAMSAIYEKTGNPAGKDGFLLMIFATALVLAAGLAFRDHFNGTAKISKADLLFGLLIGIPNYYSTRFLLLALGSMEAVIVYPVAGVSVLIVVTIAGLLCFREKLSRKKATAILMIAAALALINM